MRHETFDLDDRSAATELHGLTTLAADICAATSAIVLLGDAERQVLASVYGVDETAIPLDGSLSARPPIGDSFDVVIDMASDARFERHPLVIRSPFMRFFAAVSLNASNGASFGWLCVLDPAPRRLSPVQRRGLVTLKKQIELHFELRRQRVHARARAEDMRARAIDERDRAVDERDRFFDLSLDPMCVVDATGFFVRVNRAFYAMLGFARDVEMTGLRSLDFVHPDDRARTIESAKSLRELAGEPQRMEVRYRHRDGTYRCLSWTAIADPAMRHIYAIARDLTDSRRIEAENMHAQKMEAVGRVASGVAHDFNNLLAIIMAASATIETYLPEGNPAREELTSIFEASEHAATLTRQLLGFVRKPIELRLEPTNLVSTVEGVVRLVRRTLGTGIDLVVDVREPNAKIRGDVSQLQQVLMNLVLNARDALPHGGWIEVAVERSSRDGKDLVRLIVRDNGTGMDEVTRARIFEPFFTTKPPERGTGLGLSTVFGIVSQHRAAISVDSQPGNGTAFTIEFPAA